MGRRRHVHLETAEKVLSHGTERAALLCGLAPSSWIGSTAEVKDVSCPTCSKLHALQGIAARAPDAPALALENYEAQTWYRFCYRALLGGEHVAFVGYEGAFGGDWHISIISVKEDEDFKIIVGDQLQETIQYTSSNRTYEKKLKYASKEAALLDVARLVEAGELKSAGATVAAAKNWKTVREQRTRSWEQEQAALEQMRQDDLAGLKEIQARDDLPLTNFQRSALARTIITAQLKYGDAD
jgi:hypothetical protein